MSRKTCTYEMFLGALRELEADGVEPTYAVITTWLCEHEGIRVSASTIRGFKQQQATLAKPVEVQRSRITTAGTAREAITRALDDVANTVAAALSTIERTVDSELSACREASAMEFTTTIAEIRAESTKRIDELNQELEGTMQELDEVIEHNNVLTDEVARLGEALTASLTRSRELELVNMHLLAKLGLLPEATESIEESSSDAPAATKTTDPEPVYQTMVVDPDPHVTDPFPPSAGEAGDD